METKQNIDNPHIQTILRCAYRPGACALDRDGLIAAAGVIDELIAASAAVCRNWESPLLCDYVRQLENVLAEIEKGA